jgi:hypothetical protein
LQPVDVVHDVDAVVDSSSSTDEAEKSCAVHSFDSGKADVKTPHDHTLRTVNIIQALNLKADRRPHHCRKSAHLEFCAYECLGRRQSLLCIPATDTPSETERSYGGGAIDSDSEMVKR